MHKEGWLSAAALAVVLFLMAALLALLLLPSPEEERHSRIISVLMPDGTVENVELETFLVHVVAAEMPVSFHQEALKAQAVAARTYIAARMNAPKHGDAVVCCDSACCQAWKSTEELKTQWGRDYTRYLEKVASAVADTRDLILCYEDAPAQAFFFSTCGGYTESASAVWGGSYDYLVPQPCTDCKHAARYTGSVCFSLAEAAALLNVTEDEVREMSALSYTDSGRVNMLQAGTRQYAGTEVRSLLGLNSTAFTWLIRGDEIVFLTLGYGHGVGMCQYGADGMANRGLRYSEILLYYYPGCTIQEFSCIIDP